MMEGLLAAVPVQITYGRDVGMSVCAFVPQDVCVRV
jgi:hypothetical protein